MPVSVPVPVPASVPVPVSVSVSVPRGIARLQQEREKKVPPPPLSALLESDSIRELGVDRAQPHQCGFRDQCLLMAAIYHRPVTPYTIISRQLQGVFIYTRSYYQCYNVSAGLCVLLGVHKHTHSLSLSLSLFLSLFLSLYLSLSHTHTHTHTQI